MTDLKYQAEVQVTKSDQFHGEMVAFTAFDLILRRSIKTLSELDQIKKSLYYGKVIDDNAPEMGEEDCFEIFSGLNSNKSQAIDIIHSIIGKATEAGELLELLHGVLFLGKSFDVANFREEIGDGLWYDAIGLEAIGSTFEEVKAINIAKLRARFHNKFTEFDANNRDLVAERAILENDTLGKDQ